MSGDGVLPAATNKPTKPGGEQLVRLTLDGCDDSTTINIGVNDEQLEFLLRLEAMFKAASDCPCMPVLVVEKRGAA